MAQPIFFTGQDSMLEGSRFRLNTSLYSSYIFYGWIYEDASASKVLNKFLYYPKRTSQIESTRSTWFNLNNFYTESKRGNREMIKKIRNPEAVFLLSKYVHLDYIVPQVTLCGKNNHHGSTIKCLDMLSKNLSLAWPIFNIEPLKDVYPGNVAGLISNR